MTSFNLFKIKNKSDVVESISVQWNSKLKVPAGTSENIRIKLNKIETNTENGEILKDSFKNGETRLILNYKHRVSYEEQDIWISDSMEIIKKGHLLLIQKVSSQSNFLVEKQFNQEIIPISYSNKDLLKLWNRIKNRSKNDRNRIQLHRIILEHTYLDSDEIKELNIHSKDVSEIGLFTELTKLAKKIKAITVKIHGISNENKPFTVRIGQKSIQIYGNHPIESILIFIGYLE